MIGPKGVGTNGQPQQTNGQAHSNGIAQFLSKMSKTEKIVRAATHLRCQNRIGPQTQCPCEGWKKNIMPSAAPGQPSNVECATCKHSVLHHGIQSLKPDELDRVVTLVIQLEQHTLEANKCASVDKVKHDKHMEFINKAQNILKDHFTFLRRNQPSQNHGAVAPPGQPGHPTGIPNHSTGQTHGANPQAGAALTHPVLQNGNLPGNVVGQQMSGKVTDMLGVPPFELPSISQKILRNFVDVRYNQEHKRVMAEKLAKWFEATLERLELAPPAPTNSDLNPHEKMWILTWKRWKYFCRVLPPPQKCRLNDIFGKGTLRFLLRQNQLKEVIRKCRTVSPEMETFVPEFFSELDKEISNDQSMVLQMAAPAVKPEEVHHAAVNKVQTNGALQPAAPAPGPGRKRKPSDPPVHQSKRLKNEVGENGQMMQQSNVHNAKPTHPQDPNSEKQFKREEDRIIKARDEETQGVIQFSVFYNDKLPQHVIWLCRLKVIFSQQLPKMPKDYIVRLVFDRNHRALAVLKTVDEGKEKDVVGGISFRPFKSQGFIEIVFCAVTHTEQKGGYGKQLMNRLKVYAQQEGILRFLTYADKYAIGYFKKQGFTKTITLEESKWKGYIKDYVGATLMECVIHPNINYQTVPEMLKKQKKLYHDLINEIQPSKQHIVHKGGLEEFKDSRGIICIHEVPGFKDSVWVPPPPSPEELDRLFRDMREILVLMRDHPSSWPFHHPVDRNQVPDYEDHIKDPIDMEMIERRLKRGNYYITKEIFLADVKRMCDNCRYYNRPDTEYFKCANEIENEFVKGAKYFKR
ncbi:hypothetical protein PROFUN_07029 [Planoprotostelium fungivorum]|uniref:Histone acetyltransferase n=1 Tax=Planoprotostelium fungivorum TaxID=1890364 RepID=A0A2P6NMU9_9EUKA|nr:hypothetical protein PROFUN_07029 [Planoprotostelium fungivorum]